MIKRFLPLAFAIAAHAAVAADPSVPPFAKGDLVAFAGDSITSGGTYHKYILTYWTTRHPELGVRIRNKGIFSDFVRGAIARLDNDILKEKSNKVVISFGMNDSGASYRLDLFGMDQPDETVLQKRSETVANFRTNMDKLLGLLKERGVTPVLAGPSIYDNTMKSEAVNHLDANTGIQACIAELRELKTGNSLGFVDFNAPMLAVNARMQAKDPAFGLAGEDRVHPGAEGHWVMAYEFLRAQNASPVVATIKVDAARSAVLESANCAIEGLLAGKHRVAFDYVPRSLPLPVNDEYRSGEKVLPLTELLNFETLAAQGLRQGRYSLLLDGQNAGEFSAEELAAGINIATLEANPGQRRAREIDALIQQRARIENRIRQLRQMDAGDIGKKPREEVAARISRLLEESTQSNNKVMIRRCTTYLADFPQESALDQMILDLEARIASAAQPRLIKVSIEPAPAQQMNQPPQ
jgi:lysophospholipase L1-like esterase